MHAITNCDYIYSCTNVLVTYIHTHAHTPPHTSLCTACTNLHATQDSRDEWQGPTPPSAERQQLWRAVRACGAASVLVRVTSGWLALAEEMLLQVPVDVLMLCMGEGAARAGSVLDGARCMAGWAVCGPAP